MIPIIIMAYLSTGSLLEFDSLDALRQLLVDHGWTWLTAVCTMLFSLMHWPCSTTCLTIGKETEKRQVDPALHRHPHRHRHGKRSASWWPPPPACWAWHEG